MYKEEYNILKTFLRGVTPCIFISSRINSVIIMHKGMLIILTYNLFVNFIWCLALKEKRLHEIFIDTVSSSRRTLPWERY